MADRDFDDIQGAEDYLKMVHFAAESALEASDEEITEAMEAAGKDPKETADRLRAKLMDAAERGRKQRLKVLNKRWKRHGARIQGLDHRIPATPELRLEMLYQVVEHEPQLRQQITVQHKDLKDLDDADVTRYLRQLTELGALDHLWDEEEGEE